MYFTDEFKTKRVGAWCAATPKNQWLQVDLGINKYITAVGTQGDKFIICWLLKCSTLVQTFLKANYFLRAVCSVSMEQSTKLIQSFKDRKPFSSVNLKYWFFSNTIGRHKYYEHVKSYKLAFSQDGTTWSFFKTSGEDKVRNKALFYFMKTCEVSHSEHIAEI